MHIKNFRQYTPENPDVPGAMYLKSEDGQDWYWICPYISRHLLSLNPLQARCRRYSRGER